jgi:PAS domain S-box-containing protein
MRGRGKNLNSRLAESELKYHSVFNHSFDGILLTTPDGKILAANPAACRMFGRSEEEMCRLGRTGVMNINDPRLEPALEQRELTGEFAGELTGVRSDGTLFPVELTTSVFTDSSGEQRTSMIIRDISFRKRFRDELEVREAHVRSVIENTDNCIWSVDSNFRFLDGNSAFQERFQTRTGRRIRQGDDVIEWLPEESREKWKRYLTRGLSGISFTTMSSTGSGIRKKYVRYSFNPVRNISGEVTGLAIMGTDVTDLMKMQKGILRSGQMLKEAQSVSKLGNWEYDARLNKAGWSEELLRIFGLPATTGETSWDVHLGRIHPDDLLPFEAAVMKAYSEGIPFAIVFRIRVPGEELKWIRAICKTEKDNQGNVIRLYGTVQDVSEQEKVERELARSEERYRNLFEKSVVPIIEEDFSEVRHYFDKLRRRGVKDFRKYFTRYPERAAQCVSMVKIRDVNSTSIRFFGVNQKSDLITKLDIFFAQDAYRIFVEEIIALAEGRSEFESDIPVKMPGGEERFIHLRLHVLPDEGDSLSQVLVSWIDITDRVNYEAGLKKSGETLRRLNMHIEEAREKERTEIAMNLHDDLGQKLTALKMNLSWLRKRIGVQSALVTDKLDEVEQIIKSSIGTVQKISSDLRPAILYELGLKDAVEWHIKQNLEPAGIKGSFRLEPEDLQLDKSSSIVLFRIIQEALTNIIRHSGARRADIRISRFLSYAELIIKDNGKGIESEAANDPKSFGLTGIKERVRNSSGQFRITGEKGKGTILIVRIPLHKMQHTDDQGNNNR